MHIWPFDHVKYQIFKLGLIWGSDQAETVMLQIQSQPGLIDINLKLIEFLKRESQPSPSSKLALISINPATPPPPTALPKMYQFSP